MLIPRAAPIRALVRRDAQVERTYGLGWIGDVLFGLLSMAIFYFISKTLRPAPGADLGGAPSYFAYAAVGIALVSVTASASILLARRVREEQLTGTLEALAAAPVTATETALGLAGFPFMRATVRAAIYVVGADVLLGLGLTDPDWLGFVVVIAAAIAVIVSIGIAMAAVVLVIKRAEVLMTLLVFGLGFLGGGYFPRSKLPGALETLGSAVPTRYAFDGARSALIHGGGWGDDVLVLLGMGAVGLPVAIGLFAAAFEFSRRRGTLARY